MVGNNEEIDLERDEPEDPFIEKIKCLNVKKGDVLIIKYKDPLIHKMNVPHDVWQKSMQHNIEMVSKFVKENYGGLVGMLTVPDSIDFEVIRLEEWFV